MPSNDDSIRIASANLDQKLRDTSAVIRGLCHIFVTVGLVTLVAMLFRDPTARDTIQTPQQTKVSQSCVL